jgi:hypothetical protein
MLEQLLKEQELQLTGVVDSETAVEIGKLVGAQLVVIGSIVKTGTVYTINSRFIDVETGIAKVGQNIRGQGEDQISNMVRQLALIIAGKTVTTEELFPDAEAPISPAEGATQLFSFEDDREVQQWSPWGQPPKSMRRSPDYATDGDHSLHIVFPKNTEYPEIDTTYAPEDWSSYAIFAFDLYYDTQQADTTWTLGVRIDDRQTTSQNQQWFATGFMIFPGMNTIKMYVEDISHKVDLRQIQRVMLFTNDLEGDVEVYLDNVRFESAQVTQIVEPFIFSFEDKNDVKAWQPTNDDRRIKIKQSKDHSTQATSSLEVKLPKTSSKNEYPGMMSSNFPRDWSQYTQFAVDLYLEPMKKDVPLELAIRIDDSASSSYETRFNWDMPLQPGSHEIRIPLETIKAAIDVTNIKAVFIFLNEPGEKTTLYVDNIRVE